MSIAADRIEVILGTQVNAVEELRAIVGTNFGLDSEALAAIQRARTVLGQIEEAFDLAQQTISTNRNSIPRGLFQ